MNTLFSLPLLAPMSAAGGEQGGGSMVVTLVMFGAIMLIFYFLILRPQNKKQKEHQKMLAAVKKGDRIETIGGIRGTVFSVKDDSVVLKVDDSTKLEFVRSAIGKVLEVKGGTEKASKGSKESKADEAAKAEAPAAEEEASQDDK